MKGDEKYKTILVIVTGFALLAIPGRHHWPLYVAAGIGLLTLIVPITGDWLVKGWYKLAEILGAINSKILLSIVFYIFLYPIALISRLSKKDPLRLKRDDKTDSYFIIRKHKYTKEDMENLW